jgi:hypothetical protein
MKLQFKIEFGEDDNVVTFIWDNFDSDFLKRICYEYQNNSVEVYSNSPNVLAEKLEYVNFPKVLRTHKPIILKIESLGNDDSGEYITFIHDSVMRVNYFSYYIENEYIEDELNIIPRFKKWNPSY